MQPRIANLVNELLNEEEIAVAERLDFLIHHRTKGKAWALLEQILPKYWREDDGFLRTLAPDGVYRTIYYLDNPLEFRRNARYPIFMMGQHLEGLLGEFLDVHDRPLGALAQVWYMHARTELALLLLQFNEFYIQAKHLCSDPLLPQRLDERTFSTQEAVYCLLITRSLSSRLMDLLKEAGRPLREGWRPIQPEWKTWCSEEPRNPGRGGIAQREHP